MIPITVYYPEATPAQGNTGVKAILSVASPEAASLATEVNGATSLDLSCFLRDWNPDPTVNTGTAPPRLCAPAELTNEGRVVYGAIEARYIYNPQEDDTHNDNKAKALLAKGTILHLLVRKGLDADEDPYATGQHYELWKVRAGAQIKTRSGDGEFDELEIKQNFYPLGEPVDGVIAA